jgi:hypothetical protein
MIRVVIFDVKENFFIHVNFDFALVVLDKMVGPLACSEDSREGNGSQLNFNFSTC